MKMADLHLDIYSLAIGGSNDSGTETSMFNSICAQVFPCLSMFREATPPPPYVSTVHLQRCIITSESAGHDKIEGVDAGELVSGNFSSDQM